MSRSPSATLPVRTRVSLTGPLVVARDIAHAKIAERLDAGEAMPDYLRDHPVYYAGPAKTPDGYASGSFGPTTAGRMDAYVERFQAAGGSQVMLAKGNRSAQVTRACRTYGGFYLGSIGGPAARLAQDCIRHVEVLRLQPSSVMVVVITSTGGVTKRVFRLDEPVDPGLVAWAGEYLEEQLVGQRIGSSTVRRRLDAPELGPGGRGPGLLPARPDGAGI